MRGFIPVRSLSSFLLPNGIVGAGPAGLSAGISLTKNNEPSFILEKSHRPGGLLNTIDFDGAPFEIGCNTFGAGTVSLINQHLRVKQPFAAVHNQLLFVSEHTVQHDLLMPFDLKSLWRLFYLLDILSIMGYTKKHASDPSATLFTLQQQLTNPLFINYLNTLVPYFLARPPQEITLDLLQKLNNHHGYNQPHIALGGTQALVNNLVEKYTDSGGQIYYNMEYIDTSIGTEDPLYLRVCDTQSNQHKEMTAKTLITPQAGWDQYPRESKSSLSVGMVLFKMNPSFAYPVGVHTIACVPANVGEVLLQHDQGEWADQFAFHFFTIDPFQQKRSASYGITAYFLSPRGIEDYTPLEKQKIFDHITRTITSRFPGFESAIEARQIISPADYEQRFQMKPHILPLLWPVSAPRSSVKCCDSSQKIYSIGNAAADPEAQNVSGALLSGIQIADLISHKDKDTPITIEELLVAAKHGEEADYKKLLLALLLFSTPLLYYKFFHGRAYSCTTEVSIENRNNFWNNPQALKEKDTNLEAPQACQLKS